MPSPSVNKLVLAVHGIGDQTRNSTILSTAAQFCHSFGYRALLPLGGFYDTLQNGAPPFVITATPPDASGPINTIGFAEIYWADLAREIATAGYTLQETKEWCRSVVSRVRVLAERREPGRSDIHYGQIEYVLDEAIDAIGTMESLLFLAKKAGIMDFDLNRMLDDYLGDVQLVTEFAGVRAGILGRLHDAFGNAHALYPDAEIHVVAHSEGTVVAFLGLLQAASDPIKYPWIRQVRGLMTIGSPIDKHLILWPDLFTEFKGPHPSLGSSPNSTLAEASAAATPGSATTASAGAETGVHASPAGTRSATPRIRWLNYVDNGDPVGFELDTARWWMGVHGYDRVFNFTANDDYYFTRYPVPGKAHTDYWNDPDVFQHFIMTVVAPPVTNDDPPSSAQREALKNGPRSLGWAKFTSYVVAYLIPLAAAFAAVWFLTKGVEQYLDPKGEEDHPDLIRNVLAMGLLLTGATVWLRLTQLVRSWGWHLGGLLIYATCATAFVVIASPTPDLEWFATLPAHLNSDWSDSRIGLLVISAGLIIVVMLANSRVLRSLLAVVFPQRMSRSPAAAQAAFSSSAPSKKKSASESTPLFRNTIRVMLVLGGTALVLNAAAYAHFVQPAHAPLWPILLGAAAFLYLWRMASLVFDLVFIWHRYIRYSGALTFLRHAILPAAASATPTARGGKK